ncbi:MAG: MlaD family protein [Planctomycetota bacterium]
MRTILRDFATGVTAILGLLLIGWLLLQFGELANVGRKWQQFGIVSDSASGLSSVARVTLNGVTVGNVTELVNEPDGRVRVKVRVQDGVYLPEDFEAHVDAAFVGEATLDLRSASGESVAAVPGEGEVYERDLITLAESLREEFAGPAGNLEEVTDAAVSLAATYEELGKEAVALTARVRESLERFDETATAAREGLTTVTEEARQTAQTLREETSRGVDALTSVSTSTAETLAVARGTMREADDVLAAVRDLARAATDGPGTLARLLKDPALHNNLVTLTEELDQTLVEVRLTLEQFREEGVSVGF